MLKIMQYKLSIMEKIQMIHFLNKSVPSTSCGCSFSESSSLSSLALLPPPKRDEKYPFFFFLLLDGNMLSFVTFFPSGRSSNALVMCNVCIAWWHV